MPPAPRRLQRRPADFCHGLLGGALAVAALAAMAAWLAACGDPAPPRHLVLVVFDTLRADRTSLYGYERPTTPVLAGLSGELLRYAEVKAPAPWTVPTHSSIFTGLWPAEHRAQWGRMKLGDRFETLAETLAGHGFCTTGVTANVLVSRSTGLDQGFANYELVRGPWPEKTAKILGKVPAALDEAERRGCRLFLFLNLMDAHIPYTSDPHGAEFGAPDPGPVHNARTKWEVSAGVRPFPAEDRARHGAAYDAAVRYLDDAARDLLAMLRERGMLEETLVVFTSDHGDGLGQHPEIGHSISVWEEQLAVPLAMRLPRARRGGEVFARRTTLTSLAPTLLDLLAVPRPAAIASAPDLEQAAARPVAADYRSYFAELNRATNTRMAELYPDLARRIVHAHAVYCGRHKLVAQADGTHRLYDLVSDPAEQIDVARSETEAVARCEELRQKLLAAGRLTPFDESDADDPEGSQVDLEDLKALGYVQ